ncbi:MAG: hypothetical protein RSC43_00465 [Clostridia bacterium]
MSKLYTRSTQLVTTHLSVPTDIQKKLLAVVSMITEDTNAYTGEVTLVPILAAKSKTIRVISDSKVFRKMAGHSKASDWMTIPGTQDIVHVEVYSVREEEVTRVAIFSEALPLDFAINMTDSPAYVKKFFNFPKITMDFKAEFPTQAVNPDDNWKLYGYHTENSSVPRYLVQYTMSDMDTPVTPNMIAQVQKIAVPYVDKTGVFSGK